ncbi:MAG: pentapeptide repeat-containing protein [Thainema sp.]
MSTQPPHTQPIPPPDGNARSQFPSPDSTIPPAANPNQDPANPSATPANADQYYWQHWPEVQAQFLQQQLVDAVERSEKFAKHLDQQVKFFKAGFGILAVVFTAFFTYLQIRQIFLDGRENRRTSRQDAWELIHSVISNGNETSAGLTFAIETLTQQCESLSGLELKNRYLPEIKFVPPSDNSVSSGLEQIGHVFGVRPERDCSEREQVDLRGINLTGSTLFEAAFREADLQGANFQAAKLHGTVFTAVDLRESNFQDAQLNQVQFQAVDLEGSNLSRAMLPGAQFLVDASDKADFKSQLSNLNGANFQNAKLCEFPAGSDPQTMTVEQHQEHCADLRQTRNLAFDQIQQAQDWQYALYNSITCEQFRTQGMTEETTPVSCQPMRSQSAHLNNPEFN